MTAISVSERLLEMAAFYTPLALTVTKMSLICFSQRKENSAASGRDARPLRCPMFAYRFMSAAYFLQRQRKVTICALVQSAAGLNVVLVVPLVMSFLAAHRTASA